MKFIKNRKGFTLIEVIIATAIMSVVSVVVAVMISSGTNMFVNVYARSGLMFKSQVASLQIRDIFTDCEGIATVDDNCLALVDEEDNKLYRFYFDETEETIFIDDYNVDPVGKTKTKVEERVPLCYKVKGMHLMPNSDAAVLGEIEYIKFVLTVTNKSIDYARNEILSFRSKPVFLTGRITEEDEAAGIDNLEDKLIHTVWEE